MNDVTRPPVVPASDTVMPARRPAWPAPLQAVRATSDPVLVDTSAAQAADAQATLHVLAGKWVIPIVLVLRAGPRRHGELQRELGPRIHQKVLTETLRRMEGLGLLTRSVVADIPPSVTYKLTDLGATLLEPIAHLATWKTLHGNRLPPDRGDDPDPGSTAGSIRAGGTQDAIQRVGET